MQTFRGDLIGIFYRHVSPITGGTWWDATQQCWQHAARGADANVLPCGHVFFLVSPNLVAISLLIDLEHNEPV